MKIKSIPLLVKLFAIYGLMIFPVVSMATSLDILGGTSNFYTTSSYFPGFGNLVGLPTGPGGTDTSIMRMGNCALDLSNSGSSCQVNVELMRLDLQGKTDPNLMFRESILSSTPTTGIMTIFSEGSGIGGTFNADWSVYIDISRDAGQTWAQSPVQGFSATSIGTHWTIDPFGIITSGLVGDLNSNLHTNKDLTTQVDFFPDGTVLETNPIGAYDQFVSSVPEPAIIWLFIFGLIGLGGFRNSHKPINYFEKIMLKIKGSDQSLFRVV